MGKDIFISYSRKDTAVADRICNALDRAGISYFIDRKGIAGGMEFPEILAHAIVDCKIFLFLASRNSYQSDYTANEITFAFNRKRKMLPYIIDGSELPLALEFTFSRINWRTIEDHPIETVLVNDLKALLGHAQAAQTAPQPTPEEMFQRGKAAYGAEQYTEAIEWYSKAAEQGHPEAQCNLGVHYIKGEGISKNWTEAVTWFRKAAEQGNSRAQFNLGLCYSRGEGVAQNWAEAVRWYREAAEHGNDKAQNRLGNCYFNGEGVAQNWKEAVRWYRKAAERGNAYAQFNLGNQLLLWRRYKQEFG